MPVAGDLTRPDDVETLVTTAVDTYGGVDVLVLNGGGPPPGPAVGMTPEAVSAAVELLLTCHVRLVERCLPYLRESGHGRIVAIESTSVKEPLPNLALSNAVRPGVVGWLKTLARELGPDGVTVNVIAPGRIDTDRFRQVYPDGLSAADLETIALRRIGSPSEIATVACFLASGCRGVRHRHGDPRRRRLHARAALSVRRLAHTRVLLWAAAIVVSVAFVLLAAAWVYPTSSFLFLPHEAQPLDGRVEVEGGKRVDNRGGIYYVDVTVRRARWIERLLPFTRPDGATMVPEHALLQQGSSFEERRRVSLAEMARSEEVAAAVALRAAGYDVDAEPRGAIVESIDPSAPAVSVLKDGDVIVEAAGKRVRTTGDLRRAVGTVDPGESVVLRLRRDGRQTGADRADDAGAGRSAIGRSSASGSRRLRTSSCRSRSTSTSVTSAGRRPGCRSRSTSSRSSDGTSTAATASPRPASSSSTARSRPSAA